MWVAPTFGGDERKHRLKSDTEQAWHRCADAFRANPLITGVDLFAFACELARQSGWQFANRTAGHLPEKRARCFACVAGFGG